MSNRILVIGNKNYSSWSLRPWLFLRKNKLHFTEQQLWLDVPEFKAQVAHFNSGGKVPVLMDDGVVVWDSLAIIETVIDRYDCAYGWPQDSQARAHARASACEMHSGFMALRDQCPMDIRAAYTKPLSVDTEADIERICHLWSQALEMSKSQGRWLYGDFSAADAMFAPVVFRFQTYAIPLSPTLQRYMDYVLADSDLSEWVKAAGQEAQVIPL